MFEDDDKIVNLIREHFRYLHWEDDDIELAASWIRMLAAVAHVANLPITHRKFPETLRCMANVLEIINVENQKLKKS